MSLPRELAHVFDNVAALYDWARPSYPASLLDTLGDQIDLATATVCDLGAGTGKHAWGPFVRSISWVQRDLARKPTRTTRR